VAQNLLFTIRGGPSRRGGQKKKGFLFKGPAEKLESKSGGSNPVPARVMQKTRKIRAFGLFAGRTSRGESFAKKGEKKGVGGQRVDSEGREKKEN